MKEDRPRIDWQEAYARLERARQAVEAGGQRPPEEVQRILRERAEALARPPALILLDLMLPNVSGWEVTRRLREDARTRAIPIIAVSALARAQEREAALSAGCDAYLTKPFTPDDLVRLITATMLSEGVAPR